MLFGDFLSTSLGNDPVVQDISIFPNPTSDQLFINTNAIDGLIPNKIILFDILGRLVMEHHITDVSQPVTVSNVDAGVYLYVLAKNNIQLGSGKLVKN